MPYILRDLHREGANLVSANLSASSTLLEYWHHILCECRQFLLIVEPLELVGAIPLDIAITIPSKAGKNGTLKVIKEIHNRFFGFGIFLFGGNLCRRCLYKL